MIKTSVALGLTMLLLGGGIIKPAVNKQMTGTYDPGLNLMGDFIVNSYIEDLDTLMDYSEASARPSNVVCYIDEEGYQTDSKGVSFSEKYADIYDWFIKGKMIPLYYIDTQAKATQFVEYCNLANIYDMGVISPDPILLSSIHENVVTLHCVLDCSSQETLPLKETLKQANKAGARTIILSQKQATESNIYFFQARTKCVWVNSHSSSDIEMIREVTDGAYGAIYDDPYHAIEVLGAFSKNSLNRQYNLNRHALNIAHRGLYSTQYENSLEGCIAAYESGATHFEIDIQVTKDKKLAIMHDDKIDATTNGTGRVSDLTAEELKQFRIDTINRHAVQGEGVPIPMLDEFFTYFKGKDIVIIIEIKTSASDCVEILKKYIDEYDFYDQCVVISFYVPQLVKMKETIPEVPTADLNPYGDGTLMTSLEMLGRRNMAVDTNASNHTAAFVRHLAERGYEGWFWTYETLTNVLGKTGINGKAFGITNNVAEQLKDFAISLQIPDELETTLPFEEYKPKGHFITYGGPNEEEIEASPFFIEDHEDYALVIYQASYASSTTPKYRAVVFSDIVKVTKASVPAVSMEEQSEQAVSSEPEPAQTTSETPVQPDVPKQNAAAILIPSIGGGVLLVAGIIVAVVLIVKAKKRRNLK